MVTRREALAYAAGAFAMLGAMPGMQKSSGYITVPGGKVRYWKYGSGSRTPLLTLHGGPGAAHNYLLPLKALADDRPVIFYDQLGCGQSDAPPDKKWYHADRFVTELDAVREALGLERVVLFGHSWGTMLAIEYFATGHGRGVEKLILGGALASVTQFVEGTIRLVRQMPNGQRLLELNASGHTSGPEYEKLINAFYAQHVIRTQPNADVQASFAYVDKSPAYAYMNGPNEITVVGNLKHWDRRKDLHKIDVPLLLLTGQFDEVSLDCHETIRDGVGGPATLKVLPNCSHVAMQEAPALYNEHIRSFLS